MICWRRRSSYSEKDSSGYDLLEEEEELISKKHSSGYELLEEELIQFADTAKMTAETVLYGPVVCRTNYGNDRATTIPGRYRIQKLNKTIIKRQKEQGK
ncbi:UNVERIFIED_CONTAM: hypothetical protein FKN15_050472 [Acipenser sinensis]